MGAVTTDFIKDIVKDFGLDIDPDAAQNIMDDVKGEEEKKEEEKKDEDKKQ